MLGPNQDLHHSLGVKGPELMEWFFPTRVWRSVHGHVDGETGIDNEIAQQGFTGIGAWSTGFSRHEQRDDVTLIIARCRQGRCQIVGAHARVRSVTFVGWLFIVIGIVGFAYHALDVHDHGQLDPEAVGFCCFG
jgi:hypothetical protein